MTAPTVSARRIGLEQQPLVTIDDFAPNPELLRTAAMACQFGPAEHHYPGIRAALPKSYFSDVENTLCGVLAEVFDCRRSLRIIDASFSIATFPPAALTLEQRIPHVDALVPGRIALVHYLSLEDGSGTAFYRHRSTGFETIDEARAPIYMAQLKPELAATPPPAAYIAGDTELFLCTARAEARFNRAIIYRSGLLHSGAIEPGAMLSLDPECGRLTITAFFDAA